MIHSLDGHNQTCGAAPERPFTRHRGRPSRLRQSTSADCSARRRLAVATRRPAFLSRLVDARVACRAAGDGSPPTIHRADTGSRLGLCAATHRRSPQRRCNGPSRSAQPGGPDAVRRRAPLAICHPPERLPFKVGVSWAPDASLSRRRRRRPARVRRARSPSRNASLCDCGRVVATHRTKSRPLRRRSSNGSWRRLSDDPWAARARRIPRRTPHVPRSDVYCGVICLLAIWRRRLWARGCRGGMRHFWRIMRRAWRIYPVIRVNAAATSSPRTSRSRRAR